MWEAFSAHPLLAFPLHIMKSLRNKSSLIGTIQNSDYDEFETILDFLNQPTLFFRDPETECVDFELKLFCNVRRLDTFVK